MSNIYDDVALLQEQMTTVQSQLAEIYPQNISENTDLNDLTVGNYIIPSTAISATIANKPVTSNATAIVNVSRCATSNSLMMKYWPCDKVNPSYYQRCYYGGTWGEWKSVNLIDSGYGSLPLESGISAHDASNFPCRYRKVGNVVYVEGCVKGFTEVEKVVAILPEGFRPNASFYSQQATNGGNTDTFLVRANGEIRRMACTLENRNVDNYHFINFNFLTGD